MGPPQDDTTFTIMMQVDSACPQLQQLLPSTDAGGADGASSEHSGFWSRVQLADPEAAALQAPNAASHDQLHIKSPCTLMKIISAGTMSMQLSGLRLQGKAGAR